MKTNRAMLRNALWITILLIAAACIVYGCASPFEREEWEIVLTKAINICFQCIGLG